MLKVGLTGGIGSGKSEVSSLFKEWGAHIFDADSISKNILNNDKIAQSEIIAEFGTDILNKDNKIENFRNYFTLCDLIIILYVF